MKYLAKVVTVILLGTLSLTPALAAVPCQQGSGCMACCSGIMCPMMAKMMSREMAAHHGMTEVSAPDCSSLPHSSIAVTDRQASDAPDAIANRNGISYILPVPRTRHFRKDSAELYGRYGPRAQAVLSTFLI